MKIYNVVQGSPEWHAVRAKHGNRGASNAPAMMGESKRMMRTELVRMAATGDEKEFSAWVQENLLNRGHEVEVYGVAVAEEVLGDELYPATIGDDAEYLMASYDGITMAGKDGCEVKLWNEELAAQVRAKELSPLYYWQLEQQLLVAEDLERIIFVCTDGTPKNTVWMEYVAVPGRAKQVLAGWKQFDEDVAQYEHVEVLPRAVPKAVKALPALAIQVKGEISLVSNLALFGEQLQAFIDGIDKEPSDDQAFADAEAAVKTLQAAQDALEAAEANALAQTATVDDLRRTVALYKDLARNTRLSLGKLVDARKATIRTDILTEGQRAFAAHVAGLNTRIGKPYMPQVPTNFPAVMKGKKTIVSLRDAVATELARVKIEANDIADRIQRNRQFLNAQAIGYTALFADEAQIVLKAEDDFAILVKARIAEEEKRRADERERIHKEEAEKLAQQAAAPAAPMPAGISIPSSGLPTTARNTSAPGKKPTRPTDDEIVQVLALHYRVHESAVIAWLLDMDLETAGQRMTTEFAK